MFFELEVNLSERYPSINPLSIRREKAREVFLLMRRQSNYNEYSRDKHNKKNVIRRPAGDDWF